MIAEAELGPTTRLMHAVEQLWAEIRHRHLDVPEAVLVLASGTMGSTTEVYGHFARSRWHVGDGQAPRAEFFLGAEGLRRPAVAILGTTLHEAAHGLAVTRDIVDVSDGRYHNRKFAALAAEMGIEVAKEDRTGWSQSVVPAETVTAYRVHLTVLEDALTVWRHSEVEVVRALTAPPPGPDEPDDLVELTPPARPPVNIGAVDGRGAHRGGGNYIPVVCHCTPKPRRFRIARSVFELGDISCGECGALFSEAG